MSFQTPEMARYVKQSIRDEVEQKEFIDKKLIPNTERAVIRTVKEKENMRVEELKL